MLTEIGHLTIITAFIAAIMTSLCAVSLFLPNIKIQTIYAITKITTLIQFLSLTAGMIILATLFLQDEFSTITVYQNSHSLQPVIYKITALWGNHEGSLLLWCWVLAIIAILQQIPSRLKIDIQTKIIITQAIIIMGFLGLLIYTSNPFARILPYPPEGQSLNPLLQDPGLIMHPPLLYMGYVGLSANFAIAIAALWQGELSKDLINYMRKFALFAWCFLTAGIAMGSWWAYYELGWGGFWFWDPVENASFIPWLVTTALIHSLVVSEKTGALKQWSLLLSLIAFGLSLFGTFLVRSGILTSVHSFASDPERGTFILILLALVMITAFLLFALKAHKITSKEQPFHPISREGGLLLNNFLLTASASVVLIGTIFPLFMELLTGNKISVGPPYFNISFAPIMLSAMLLMAIIPLLAWKNAKLGKAIKKLIPAFIIAVLLLTVLVFYQQELSAILAFVFAVWLMVASLLSLRDRWQGAGQVFTKIPLRFYGMFVSHFAVAMILFGIAGVSLLSQDDVHIVKGGEVINFRGHEVTFNKPVLFEKQNYLALQSELLFVNDSGSFYLRPERRLYAGSLATTTEAAIRTSIFGDFYATISEQTITGDSRFGSAETFVLHLRYKPLALFLWLSSSLMVLGGALAFFGIIRKKI